MSGRSTRPETFEEKRARKDSAMQRIRHRMANRDLQEILILEKKLLVAATASLLLAFALWTVSVSTDAWFHVSPSDGQPIYINRTNSFFVSSHSGIWRICKYVHENGTRTGATTRKCHYHRFFPSAEFIQKNTEVDRTILDFTRTEMTFSLITFCLILMGFGFSLYTFKEQRYMFKRLAGVLHFIAAAAVLVVLEVCINSVHYEEQYLNDRHPEGAVVSYGYSFAIAWITFAILVVCGLTFLLCSRKRKGDRATGLQSGDDEPQVLGRM